MFWRIWSCSLDLDPTQASLGLAEFQDRGASAKSESATSSRMWDGSIRPVRRISIVSQTSRRSRVNQNQGSASFNNGTIPDVLFLYSYTTIRFTLATSRFDFCEPNAAKMCWFTVKFLTHKFTLVRTLSCSNWTCAIPSKRSWWFCFVFTVTIDEYFSSVNFLCLITYVLLLKCCA